MVAFRVLTTGLVVCILAVSPASANLAFRPPLLLPLADARQVAVGDFNHDGTADIVTASSDAITLLVSSGNGSFTKAGAVTLPWALNTVASLATGDTNGDGHLDAIATHHAGHVAVALGDGAGGLSPGGNTFADAPTTTAFAYGAPAAVADFDGDGLTDAVVPARGTSDLWLYRGAGRLVLDGSISLPTGPGLYTAAAGDLNGDGFADVAVGHPDGSTVRIFFNTATPSHLRVQQMSRYFESSVVSFRPTGVTPGPPPPPPVGAAPAIITLADVSGDGALDIVASYANVTATSRFFSVLVNNGSGQFAPAVAYTTLGAPWHPVVADIDGDGHADVVVPNPYSWATTVHRGQGGVFDAAWADVVVTGGPGDIHDTLTIGTLPTSVGAADFDRDGRRDIVIGSPSGAAVLFQQAPADGPQRAHLDALIAELALAEAAAASIATEVTDVSAGNAAIQSQTVAATATLSETQARLASLLQHADALQQERQGQEAARASLQQQITATRAQGTSLRAQIETLTAARTQLDAEAAAAAAATGARQQQHTTAANRRGALLGEQTALRNTGDSLNAQLRSAIAERPALALQLAAAHLELARIRATIRHARGDHERERRLLDELLRRVDQLRNAINNGGRR